MSLQWSKMLQTNFYEILKYLILANFLLPYSLTDWLMHAVKRGGKLSTALLLWQKCLEFRGEKPFTILNAYVHALFSYSSTLILLYGGHFFSVWLLSKVTSGFTHHVRLPASCNNVPQHIKMFPDSTIAA